jgi:hypothetical protein
MLLEQGRKSEIERVSKESQTSVPTAAPILKTTFASGRSEVSFLGSGARREDGIENKAEQTDED